MSHTIEGTTTDGTTPSTNGRSPGEGDADTDAETVLVRWEGGRRYRGGRPGRPALLLDGSRENAPGPVDTVVIALVACAATDVVQILEKRRSRPTELRVEAVFTRASSPPRRIESIRVDFILRTDSPDHHVRRAVELSLEKYCSVAASLAPDVRIESGVEVEAP